MHDVTLYFDAISPYSWLALMEAEGFAQQHQVAWRVRPVVYAKLLDANGLVGPAESPAKRRYTFEDVFRLSAVRGLAFKGPPAHPFRSLEALRTVWLFRDAPNALELARTVVDGAWGRGLDLTDVGVLSELVSEAGCDARDLAQRLQAPETKAGLAACTQEALDARAFGVPTFVHEGEVFWGHDRLPLLAQRLAGTLPPVPRVVGKILDRPRAADRKRAPGR